VPIERTAHLMEALLGIRCRPGSSPASWNARPASGCGRVRKAMAQALRAEHVLCADDTPTNVISKNTDEHGQPVPGSPHAVTVRTPDARLMWYAPIGSRSKTALTVLGMLEGYTGYLVRNDYAGWH
jgi:Transposase IS66 family